MSPDLGCRAVENLTERQIVALARPEPAPDSHDAGGQRWPTGQQHEWKLLIGGELVDGAAGTYADREPGHRRGRGQAPEASVDAGARRGPRPRRRRSRRGRRRPAAERAAPAAGGRRPACVELQADLVPLIIAETGATATVGSRMQVPVAHRALRALRARRGARTSASRCRRQAMPATPLAPGGLMGAFVQPPAGRRGGVHHAVQLPARQHGRQDRARARDGQHRRGEARAAGPARGHRARPRSCTRSGSRPAS